MVGGRASIVQPRMLSFSVTHHFSWSATLRLGGLRGTEVFLA